MPPSVWADADFATAWALLTDGPTLAAVLIGAFAAGAIAGLTGFGTALVTLGLWLYVLPPQVAVPLVCVCSVVAHVPGLRAAVRDVSRSRIAALAGPGIIGLPVGIHSLR